MRKTRSGFDERKQIREAARRAQIVVVSRSQLQYVRMNDLKKVSDIIYFFSTKPWAVAGFFFIIEARVAP